MDINKICKSEAIGLIVVATINQVIVGVPQTILIGNASASLLNVIAITVVAILIVLAISKLFKNFQSSDIIDVSEFVGGSILKNIISIAYIALFLIIIVITLRYITEFLKLLYFQDYSIIFLSLFFIVAIAFAVTKGIRPLSRVNIFAIILSYITIFILLSGSIPRFMFERAMPIFGYGIDKTFFINLSNIFAYSGIAYLMFLMPFLKDSKDYKKISVISVIISAIYLFISVLCLLFVFPFTSVSKDLFSVFLLTRIIDYTPILERTDAIYIYFWIFCIFSYLSTNLFFILHCFGKSNKLKNYKAMVYSFCALIIGFTIPFSNVSSYYFLYNTFYAWFFIGLIFISIVILFIAKIKQKRRKS